MAQTDLVERLAAFATLGEVPPEELAWLAEHGRVELFKAGTPMTTKGEAVDHLYIVLAGRLSADRDRGAGRRRVMEWRPGDVTGRLPYSRLRTASIDNIVEVDTEVLALHEEHFTAMAGTCPGFTAHAVHLMLDRARAFNTSDQQEERMIALGKLAAGLAHELNNPASATIRAANLLARGLAETDPAVRTLGAAVLTGGQLEAIERFRAACVPAHGRSARSPLERADREDEIIGWLESRGLDLAHAAPLTDTTVDLAALDALAGAVSDEVLDAALRWTAGGCEARTLASDIQHAATRIHELVDAVKSFTYMDRSAEPELVDVGTGLEDTIRVLASKAESKSAAVSLEVEPDLPRVSVAGGELNQVWLSLLDNALDAIPESGKVDITAHQVANRVVVRVVDDGPGIEPDVLPRIFDPFFTTKQPGHGVGLGLEIARRLLRRVSADLDVESGPGRTEFKVRLPLGTHASDGSPLE